MLLSSVVDQALDECDVLCISFMAESGMDSKAYTDWQKEESGNVANDGMFSIQASPTDTRSP